MFSTDLPRLPFLGRMIIIWVLAAVLVMSELVHWMWVPEGDPDIGVGTTVALFALALLSLNFMWRRLNHIGVPGSILLVIAYAVVLLILAYTGYDSASGTIQLLVGVALLIVPGGMVRPQYRASRSRRQEEQKQVAATAAHFGTFRSASADLNQDDIRRW